MAAGAEVPPHQMTLFSLTNRSIEVLSSGWLVALEPEEITAADSHLRHVELISFSQRRISASANCSGSEEQLKQGEGTGGGWCTDGL
ncbi:unnamed protein product [Lampetra planeri]